MNLTIKQNNQVTEQVTSGVIDKLYNLTKEDVANGITAIATVLSGGLQGRIEATAAYRDAVDYLNEHFGPYLIITALSYYLRFYDPEVVRVLISKGVMQEGEGLTSSQAELLPTGTGSANQSWWSGNTQIQRFDEIKDLGRCKDGSFQMGQWFTGATNLESVDLTGFTKLNGWRLFTNCINLRYFHGYGNAPANTLNLVNLTSTTASFEGCTKLYHVTSLGVAPMMPADIFKSCSNLEDVNLPAQCTQIQHHAFYGCTNLTTINLDNLTKIDLNAFENCTNLEYCSGPNSTQGELNLPNLANTLGDLAFKGCMKLTSVTSLGSVTTIGNSAFENCSLLANINIPASVEKVNKAAFAGTAWLSSQQPNSAIIINNKCLYSFKGSLGTNYVIPSTVKYITESALYNVSGLEEITIPSSVTEVGRSCVGNNTSLITINYGSSAPIPKEFAQTCRNLTTLNITGNPTAIWEAAFKYCNLSSINIPASVTSIAVDAFFGNGDCTSISVNSNNTIFDSRNNCNAIINTASNALVKGCKNTVIPNTVTAINNYAFAGVTGMTSIDIPANVSSLGGGAFRECSQLVSVTVRAITPPSAVDSIFQSGNSNLVIYVPSGSVDAYKAASGWSTYAGRIQAIQT